MISFPPISCPFLPLYAVSCPSCSFRPVPALFRHSLLPLPVLPILFNQGGGRALTPYICFTIYGRRGGPASKRIDFH